MKLMKEDSHSEKRFQLRRDPEEIFV